MTEYRTGRTPHPKDAVSADIEEGLSNASIVTQRVRKLERVVNDLAQAADEIGEDIGITDTTPEKPQDVRARLTISDTTVRWLPAKNSYTYEIRASDWADVDGAALAGTVNVCSFIHEDIGRVQYYWVRGVNSKGTAGPWSDTCLATKSGTMDDLIDDIIRTSPIFEPLRQGITTNAARLADIEGYLMEIGTDISSVRQRIEEGELPFALMETILYAQKQRESGRNMQAAIKQTLNSWISDLGEVISRWETQLQSQITGLVDVFSVLRQTFETKITENEEAIATARLEMEAKVRENRANLMTEQKVRADADSVQASSVQILSGELRLSNATLGDGVAALNGAVNQILNLDLDPERALAGWVFDVNAGLTYEDGTALNAKVKETSEAIARIDGSAQATWMMQVQIDENGQPIHGEDSNGRPIYAMAGIGLAASVIPDPSASNGFRVVSEFGVTADRFWVCTSPGQPVSETTMPFIVIGDSVYISNAIIQNAAIDEAKIANLSVTSAKIRDAAITNAKIENAAITTAKIGNAQITKAKLASAYINELAAEIATIAEAKIAAATIQWAQIQQAIINNLEVDTAHIKKLTVDESNIVAGACSAADMAVNSYGGQLDSTWTTYASTSVTVSATKTIYIQASGSSCAGSISDVGTWASHVRVMCGSTTVIPDTPCAHWSRVQLLEGLLMPFVLAGKFTPPSAGTYTFELQARWPGGSYGSPSSGWESMIGRSSISAWQFKK